MRKMKDSGIEWIGEIPERWEITRLKYLADFEPTCDTSYLTDESEITYTPMECVKKGDFENRSALYGNLSHTLTPFQNGDIAMAKVTPCFENGNIAIMNNLFSGFGLGSSELFIFRPKSISTRYLFYWLQNKAFVARACSTMTGTGGLKRISPSFIRNCPVHCPSMDEQTKISDYLEAKCSEIDAMLSKTRSSIEEYKKLKQAVITQAVTKGVRGKREMKDSGVEWIGEVPAEWDIIKSSRIIKTTQNGLSRRDLEKSEGQIILKLKNITSDGKIDYSFLNRITLSQNELNTYALTTGDFLFVRVNGSKSLVGKCAIFEAISEIVAYNDHIIRVKLSNQCYNRFFLWYLYSCCGKAEIDLHTSTAAGQYTISGDGLRDITLVFPPIDEQKEIADYLDAKCAEIDGLIAKKEQLVKELESYKKSLIYEVVTGKREV